MAKKRRVKKVVEEKEDVKKAPVGVQVISILFYIGAVLCFFFGLRMIFSSKTEAASLVTLNPGLGLETIPQGNIIMLVIFVGILVIGAGIFSLFIGKGIWGLRKWAKITAIVLATIALVFVIFSMIMNFVPTQIMYLLIDGFIAGYLVFNKEAKKAFK